MLSGFFGWGAAIMVLIIGFGGGYAHRILQQDQLCSRSGTKHWEWHENRKIGLGVALFFGIFFILFTPLSIWGMLLLVAVAGLGSFYARSGYRSGRR